MRWPRRDARLLMLAVILALLAAGGLYGAATSGGGSAGSPVAQASVSIDATRTYQTIDGFGAESRTFDDPHVFNNYDAVAQRAATTLTTADQDAILDRLYVDLGLTRVRPVAPDVQGVAAQPPQAPVMGHSGLKVHGAGAVHARPRAAAFESIEPVNDNADPDQPDLSGFNFGGKNLDAHCMFIKRAQQRGARTFFLSPLNRESWIDVGSARDVPEYAEWLLAQVTRCRQLGVTFTLLSPVNEPSFSRNTMSGEFIRDVIKNLGPRLAAAGFAVKFVIPDDVRSSDGAKKAEVILRDPAARRYVGVLSTHLYDEPVASIRVLERLSRRYRLPLWVTEFSSALAPSSKLTSSPLDYARLISDLLGRYGVSAVDYQWGFFGQWEQDSQLIVLKSDDRNRYTGYTLTKQYYVTGQFSRFVRPGAKRVKVDSKNPAIDVTAFTRAGQLVVVALNPGATSTRERFGITGVDAIARMRAVRTDRASENWKRLRDIPVRGRGFSAVLTPGSLTTFVSRSDG